MNYLPVIDEDKGYCPKCSSGDTVSIRGKVKRVCLDCEYSEEFENFDLCLLAWQKRPNEKGRSTSLATENADSTLNLEQPVQPRKHIEKLIESIEPEITKVTIPTQYREDFSRYLASRSIELFRSAKTDVWNGIESAYTDFELRARSEIATSIVDDWLQIDRM
jgi:hypothetical protein